MTFISAQELRLLKRQIPDTFALHTPMGKMECLKILRLLPQRRLVCLVKETKTQKKCIIKLFFHAQKAQADFNQEIQGYDLLNQTKLSKPPRLNSGLWDDNSFYISYEYIENAQNLGQVLIAQHYANNFIFALLKKIAILHDSALKQEDLHLDNFLLQGDHLFILDYAEIQVFKSSQDQINNLALLLSQLPISEDEHIATRLNFYQQQLQNKHEIGLKQLNTAIDKHREYRLKKYTQKIFRNCTEFVQKQHFKSFQVYRRCFDESCWEALLTSPDQLIENGKKLKDGNSSTVALVTVNHRQFVIKRYNIKSLSHWLSRFWRPSRAWTSWRNAHILKLLGFETPLPIALIEQRFGIFRHKAYYISEYVESPDILQVYATHNTLAATHLEAVRTFFYSLKKAAISHGDLKGTNLLLSDNKLTIIDLDSMKQHRNKKAFAQAHQKDLKRFKENWTIDQTLLTKIETISTT